MLFKRTLTPFRLSFGKVLKLTVACYSRTSWIFFVSSKFQRKLKKCFKNKALRILAVKSQINKGLSQKSLYTVSFLETIKVVVSPIVFKHQKRNNQSNGIKHFMTQKEFCRLWLFMGHESWRISWGEVNEYVLVTQSVSLHLPVRHFSLLYRNRTE